MTRAEFLDRLKRGLDGLPQETVDEILADYESHFVDGAAAGRSDDDLARALGDPARLAREIRAEIGLKRWEEKKSPGNFVGAVFALLGLIMVDVIVAFPILCAIFGMAIGVAAASVGVFIAGIAILIGVAFGGFLMLGAYDTVTAVLAALGLIAGATGIGALLLLGLGALLRLLAGYARLHYRALKPIGDAAA